MKQNVSKTSKYINRISKLIKILPIKLRNKLYIFFRKTEGKKGFVIRGALLKTLVKNCGDEVMVFPNVYMSHLNKISLGSNISIHPMAYIDGAGELVIGDNISIAHGVTIMSTEHRYNNKDTPIRNQGFEYKATEISSDVWIGAKATILAGNKISSGSIIGANSVVTKDVGANSIIVGFPGRAIKNRF